ncbi:hypothetical protein PoB_003750700 [Plakobranchus ocellatus]|uniref:Uncharacterized protein n=1 Tax=Plakobranchus ocellatus TaxID=259542 RepID=A0AAV4AUK5_9GAST|nr:hypothetical protein PoB_003750700 [Plakobranchus ocellatus]
MATSNPIPAFKSESVTSCYNRTVIDSVSLLLQLIHHLLINNRSNPNLYLLLTGDDYKFGASFLIDSAVPPTPKPFRFDSLPYFYKGTTIHSVARQSYPNKNNRKEDSWQED